MWGLIYSKTMTLITGAGWKTCNIEQHCDFSSKPSQYVNFTFVFIPALFERCKLATKRQRPNTSIQPGRKQNPHKLQKLVALIGFYK